MSGPRISYLVSPDRDNEIFQHRSNSSAFSSHYSLATTRREGGRQKQTRLFGRQFQEQAEKWPICGLKLKRRRLPRVPTSA